MKSDKKIHIQFLVVFVFLNIFAMAEAQQTEVSDVKNDVEEKFGVVESEEVKGTPDQGENIQEEDLIYLNATDVDIKDMIKQISKATGTNFIIDDKVRGKITIISEKPMTKEMAYQAFLSSLEVMGYTTVKTPGGLLKIIQTKQAISAPIDLYQNNSPDTDRFITRIMQVKNISANEISTVIKALVSKDGNLFAYPATNSLIITDSGSNIDRILKIVKELDQEGPQEVIEIIPIKNADASDITEKVLQLFEEAGQGAGSRGAGRSTRSRRGSPELEETPSISKVISDERTNSVIVLGSKRAILKMRALIDKLDSSIEGIEGTIHVYYLKHAVSKEIADVLSSLVSDAAVKGAKGAKKGDEKRGAVELEGGVKVTADEGTNSLVITASPKDYQILIDKVIAKLDIPRRQVYIEAIVMQLRLDKRLNMGLSGNFGANFDISGKTITGFGSLLPIFQTAISTIAGASGGLGGGGFSADSIDFTTTDGSSISIPAVSTIIQFLQTETDANILSTPSILTLDNEEAQIQVGQEVPTPSGSTVSSGVTSFNVTREDTGVILKITPQISESDTVRLKIEQEVTDVVSTDANLGPTLSKTSVQTVIVANDKQTIVIGGLLEDKENTTRGKIPLLGDIPLLGNLFKNSSKRNLKSNLVVFITPYIIRDRSDYLAILEKKIEERNSFIEYNYSAGKRKKIRESIRRHASDLLEYRTAVSQPGQDPSYTPSSSIKTDEPSKVTTPSSQTHQSKYSSSKTNSDPGSSSDNAVASEAGEKEPATSSSTKDAEVVQKSENQKTSSEEEVRQSDQSEGNANEGYVHPSRRVKTKQKSQ